MSVILDHFSDRLKAGARADLLQLARITFVKSRTARAFYDAGFRSAAAVASADPRELVPVLMLVSCSSLPGIYMFALPRGFFLFLYLNSAGFQY